MFFESFMHLKNARWNLLIVITQYHICFQSSNCIEACYKIEIESAIPDEQDWNRETEIF